MMLPAVLDPWAGHALFEAAHLAQKTPGSKVWLVSLGPKAKLQQVMMTVAQKAPFELVALDGPASGFTDSFETAAALAAAIEAIPGLDRAAAAALRRLGIGLARRRRHAANGRGAAGHRRAVSGRGPVRSPAPTVASKSWSASKADRTRFPCAPLRPPCWAGLRAICPSRATTRRSAWPTCARSCRRCNAPRPRQARRAGLTFVSVSLPKQQRETRVVKDMPADGDRPRDRGLDCGGITMENDPGSGTHRKPMARWPSRRSKPWPRRIGWAAQLTVGLVGGEVAGRRQPDRELRRGALPGGPGEAFAQPRYATDAAAAEALARAARSHA